VQSQYQKKNYQKAAQAGFTLIEVLVTILMIGATLVIYQATSQTVVINRGSRYKEVALRIADQEIQNLRIAGYSGVPATGTFSDSQLATLPSGAGNLTVTDLNAKTKDVVVTVSWTNPQGTSAQIQLETYITQGGLGQ
jgi:prepilin-type N-terminal cleavage/methylation domain-containing protein